MMKKTILMIVLAAGAAWPSRGAETSPLFAPEPPDPDAAALVDTYLPLLAAGDYEQAIVLNDMRGMRQYLLERRMAELKARNPELTANDIQEMSVQVQLNDLNPARLQDIMLGVMKEGGTEGMTWTIQGYAPAPPPIDGHLASITTRTPEGQERPMLLGLKKLGNRWMVAPYVVEAIGSRLPPVNARRSEAPVEVLDRIEAFWTLWQTGELNEAYALMSVDYRARVPLLAFLQQAQAFIDAAGVPADWNVVKGIQSAPDTFWLGVTVNGSEAPKPTLMQFRKSGDTWLLEDLQLQMPQLAAAPPAPPAAAGSATPAPLRPNLRPDLAPALEPASVSAVPAVEPPAPPASAPQTSAPAKPDAPDAPVGPVSP